MRSAMLSAEVFFRRGEACIMYSRHLGRAQVFTLLPIGINPLTFHQNNKPTAAKGKPILNRQNHLLPGWPRRASTRRSAGIERLSKHSL